MILFAALAAALSMVLALPPVRNRGGADPPAAGVRPTPRDPGGAGPPTSPTRGGPRPVVARAAGLVAGTAAWALLGGVPGAICGTVVAVVVPIAVARLEPASARREREELVRSAPLVADLLAAALTSGIPLDRAVPAVARAVEGPAGAALRVVERRLSVGHPPAAAWSALVDVPGLGGIARSVARSARTGAPLGGILDATAEQLRAGARAEALARIRATSVRAVLPLGLCLLPSFVLLGIVPIVGGLLPSS